MSTGVYRTPAGGTVVKLARLFEAVHWGKECIRTKKSYSGKSTLRMALGLAWDLA